jgi:hypothetical protein
MVMTYAFSYDAPGNPEVYRLVSERIGTDRPRGLLVQVVSATAAGLRHLNVWESREQWEAFRDGRVRPAVADVLEQLGVPVPVEAPAEEPVDLVDVFPRPVSGEGAMFAVIGAWKMSPGQADEQRDGLARIAAGVGNISGLVSGFWTSSDDGRESHTFIVFGDLDAAEGFAAAVRRNLEEQRSAGVENVSLAVAKVTAHVRGECRVDEDPATVPNTQVPFVQVR